MTHPRTAGHYVHPGHFSMKIPGQLSAEINNLSLWRNVDGGLIVVPRVPMRTVLIERGIVQVDAPGVRVVEPPTRTALRSIPSKPRSITASEGEFFDHLTAKRPELVEPLRSFLSSATGPDFAPEIGRTIRLVLPLGPDEAATAGYIESNGKIWFQGACAAARRLGRPEAGDTYLSTISALTGGSIRRYEKSAPEVVAQGGHGTEFALLLANLEAWQQAINAFRDELTAALPDRSE